MSASAPEPRAIARTRLVRGLLLTGLLGLASAAPGAGPDDRRTLLADLAAVMAADAVVVDRFDAEVWLAAQELRLRRFAVHLADVEDRLEVLVLVRGEAARHGIDPDLALALIQVESAFDRYAVSSAGARGLMQVMPFWKFELGRQEDNLVDAATNVRYGMAILAHYLDREDGDPVRALARYHGSLADLSYPRRVFAAWATRWRTRSAQRAAPLLVACARLVGTACE